MVLFFKEFYFSIVLLLCIFNYILFIEKLLNKINDRRFLYLELEKFVYSIINKLGKNGWIDIEFVVNILEVYKLDFNFEEFSV